LNLSLGVGVGVGDVEATGPPRLHVRSRRRDAYPDGEASPGHVVRLGEDPDHVPVCGGWDLLGPADARRVRLEQNSAGELAAIDLQPPLRVREQDRHGRQEAGLAGPVRVAFGPDAGHRDERVRHDRHDVGRQAGDVEGLHREQLS
jgi:hypothetical protein